MNVVVVGAQWGDEGKGKLVDLLAEEADLVVRFQGGANAGHTLNVDGRELVTHLVPSGVLHPEKRSAIGPAVVVDPEALVAEIESLQSLGLLASPRALMLSHRAHLVLPYHRALDAARESQKGPNKIGTTLRGIGPCLEDKMARSGIRVVDLFQPATLLEKLKARLAEINVLLRHYQAQPMDPQDIFQWLLEKAKALEPFVGDVGGLVHDAIRSKHQVLFEGAQGAMLDIDHGTYPFVTSSNTVAGAVASTIGLGPWHLTSVLGVTKAYTTRVGSGPFPTEMEDTTASRFRNRGGEFGATTKRPRRLGWLDVVSLRYACNLNGCTSLGLTKMDVLSGESIIKIAVGYQLGNQTIHHLPADLDSLNRLKPIYEEVEGWEEDLRGIRRKADLPKNAQAYVRRLEALTELPIDLISVGPERKETIFCQWRQWRCH